MRGSKQYLTTGEFARVCQTTRHTLFHYCDIGLFEPAYTDENGYRYYHVLQYDTFMTIARLRTVGLSLAEIKAYLAERSPQRMAELYARQEQLIDRQIAQLKQMKSRISVQKELLRQVIACKEEFFCETQKGCLLSCSETVVQRDDEAMTTAVGDLMASTGGQASPGTTGMLCKLEDAMRSESYPFRFYARTDSAGGKRCHKKAAGTYLCTYHHGSYETLRDSYRRLVSCAESRGIEPGPWLYAATIVGDWSVWQPEDYIIKISVRAAAEAPEV